MTSITLYYHESLIIVTTALLIFGAIKAIITLVP